ncbi:MAG: hypothetical protein RLZZ553_831 [Verrucomicrobiota bacterium]
MARRPPSQHRPLRSLRPTLPPHPPQKIPPHRLRQRLADRLENRPAAGKMQLHPRQPAVCGASLPRCRTKRRPTSHHGKYLGRWCNRFCRELAHPRCPIHPRHRISSRIRFDQFDLSGRTSRIALVRIVRALPNQNSLRPSHIRMGK